MSDPIRASRLPDLPHAGFRTRNEKELSDAIMFLIRGMERDRMLLLETVIKGKLLFRKRFIAAYRAIKADETFADAVFGYLVLLADANPEAQKARLEFQASHAQTQSWDKRLRTKLKLAANRKDLEMDILRESLKPKRVYSH